MATVAKLAGVSKATASRVLNNVGTASPETRDRILAIAREKRYVPNAKFKQLSKLGETSGVCRTGNLGLLLLANSAREFSSHPYYGRLFWAIETAATKQGQHLVVSTTSDDHSGYLVKMVSEQKVDGMLVADSIDWHILEQINRVMPVVLVNNTVEGLSIPSIMPDEASGVKQALDYLRGLGHSKITFFYIADSALPNMHHIMRERAFRSLVLEGSSRLSEARVVVLPGREKSLEDTLFDQLLTWKARGEMPTALVCAADTYAVAFIEAARRLGLSVPDDLSVIGTDDTLPCEFIHPKLTSIRQPLESMGAAGVRALLEAVSSPEKSVEKVTMLFDVKLIVRGSCAKVRTDV